MHRPVAELKPSLSEREYDYWRLFLNRRYVEQENALREATGG